jgi:hypothetical protein
VTDVLHVLLVFIADLHLETVRAEQSIRLVRNPVFAADAVTVFTPTVVGAPLVTARVDAVALRAAGSEKLR